LTRDSRLERFSHLPLLGPLAGMMPDNQAKLWPLLGRVPEHFVLYGGTGLALRLGHRESVDFDFFSAEPFLPTDLLAELAWLGPASVGRSSPNNLEFATTDNVNLSFFGAMRIQSVAEPSIVVDNGLVVASIYDLAGTKAKTILDRSEWKDYVDLAALVRNGHTLPDIIGYATTIFGPLFPFPAAAFLRSLVFFEEGSAPDVPADMRWELEAAVARTTADQIPDVEPYSASILP